MLEGSLQQAGDLSMDVTDIVYVYKVCSFILLLGLLTAFLPDIEKKRK